MSPVLAAKLLTLLTLAEVWLKMRAWDDLALAHKDMRGTMLLPFVGEEIEFFKLLNAAKIWQHKKGHEEVARCHADMRELLEGVTVDG